MDPNVVNIRLSRSFVGQREADAVSRVIVESGFFGMSSEVQAFEREIAEYIGGGVEVACVSSGTASLHLALQACGVGPGDEVIVPTITYLATFQAVSATGATAIACDVDPDTSWMDIEDVRRRITPRTRALMPVHYASGMGNLAALRILAAEHNLRIIEDAAHAFGCRFEGQRVGATGDVVCFSFQGTKNITSGEGGAVVTRDLDVIERVRDLRLLAVEKDTEKRFQRKRSWEFDLAEQGWRYHMSDLNAAIGRVQLTRLESEFAPRRVALAKRYRAALAGLPGVRTLPLDYGDVVPHIYPIYLEDGLRDEVRQTLTDAGIETGIHYKPNHLLSKFGGATETLPVAERLYREMLTLPLHPQVTDEQQDAVVAVVRKLAIEHSRNVAVAV
jgi:dTDP-4-amino-4,6-dideoxygalactose transaminase